MRVSADIGPDWSNGIEEGDPRSERGSPLWRRKLVLSALLTLWISVPYYSNQRWPFFSASVMEASAIEHAIPFVQGTAWLYLSLFLLLALLVIAMSTPCDMSRFALDVAFIGLVSNLIFLFCPTSVSRPPGPATDLAYRLVIQVDSPRNACPSLHASLGIYSALWCNRLLAGCCASLWRVALWTWTLAILSATLTSRQHVLVDLLAGAFLAALVFALSGRWKWWCIMSCVLFSFPSSPSTSRTEERDGGKDVASRRNT
jgi:hypothetical protein